jgi:NAD(P)-dependent dehydrogenase (short-subunit alcohol dehydrogenase family)
VTDVTDGLTVVVGGSSGIGRATAQHYADRGAPVVITSRDTDRAAATAAEIGGDTTGIALDLAEPAAIAGQLAGLGHVRHLVIAAIERDENTVREYDVVRAARLVTLKLVGYTEVVHALLPQLRDDSSIVLFGGLAKERPYPGSTNVTSINGGVSTLIRTMAVELAPIRVNAVHPAIVGDTPYWANKPAELLQGLISRTPTGRLVETAHVVDAVRFLLENGSVNGVNLDIDGGWLLT